MNNAEKLNNELTLANIGAVVEAIVERAIAKNNIVLDKRFDAINQRFESIDKRFDVIDNRLDEMEVKFEGKLKRLEDLIDGLDHKIDVIDSKVDRHYIELQNQIDNISLNYVHRNEHVELSSRVKRIERKVFVGA